MSAEATVYGAYERTEIRGAHTRGDFPLRDDEEWMKHIFVFKKENDASDVKFKPVTVTKFQPMERKY